VEAVVVIVDAVDHRQTPGKLPSDVSSPAVNTHSPTTQANESFAQQQHVSRKTRKYFLRSLHLFAGIMWD